MHRDLVTGGLGFLGARLVRGLVHAGHQVRVLDDRSRGSVERLGEVKGQVEVVDGDVRDPEIVHRVMRDIETVWHLAYVNGTRYFYERPAHVLDVGVKGMVNVLDGCIRAGVRELFLASSSEVYQTPPRVPTDESAPLSVPDPQNPRYSYGGGKIISELMAIHYGREHFERVVIFRPHNVFGPDMGWEHVIPQFVARLVGLMASTGQGEISFPIQGTGDQSRAFIYIEDFIEALLLVMRRGEHLNIYHIGTMEEVTIRDVALKVAGCLGARIRIVPGPEATGGVARRCPDIHKLRQLGFKPRFSFDDGLPPTVRWYVEHAGSTEAADAMATAKAFSEEM